MGRQLVRMGKPRPLKVEITLVQDVGTKGATAQFRTWIETESLPSLIAKVNSMYKELETPVEVIVKKAEEQETTEPKESE